MTESYDLITEYEEFEAFKTRLGHVYVGLGCVIVYALLMLVVMF